MATLKLEVEVSEQELEEYGKEGMKELLGNILNRYGNEEYFDRNILKAIEDN